MGAWETLLAAAGGLVLGIGVGLYLGGRRERAITRTLRRLRARTRASVIPILEGRAQQLGLPRELRGYGTEDPLEAAVDLSTSIIQFEDDQDLAFSDTVELSRLDLDDEKTGS